MKPAVITFAVTIAAGYVADSFLYSWNWPGAGAIFAAAATGVFLLWSIQRKSKPD